MPNREHRLPKIHYENISGNRSRNNTQKNLKIIVRSMLASELNFIRFNRSNSQEDVTENTDNIED